MNLSLGDAILNAATSGLVNVAYPDPEANHVFVWSSGSVEQFEAAAVKHLEKCSHPATSRVTIGGEAFKPAAHWCMACGAFKESENPLWTQPSYCVQVDAPSP